MLPNNWVEKFFESPSSTIHYLLNRVIGINNLQYNLNRGGPINGTKQFVGEQFVRLRYNNDGMKIYERDWDVLVVLDACRLDLLHIVSKDYDFIPEVNSFRSIGSWTGEWREKNFITKFSDEMKETVYVSGNPQSNIFLDKNDFRQIDEVWTYAWDEDLGTVPPRPVTDRAIRIGREENPNRMIIHYLQPHVPFIGSNKSPNLYLDDFAGGDMDGISVDDWILVLRGDRKLESVMEDYENNLRLVLNDVKLLSRNIDSKQFVITSDHGNAIGEYGIYGHPGVPLPSLRNVPWCELQTNDSDDYDPPTYEKNHHSLELEEKLRSLGYR